MRSCVCGCAHKPMKTSRSKSNSRCSGTTPAMLSSPPPVKIRASSLARCTSYSDHSPRSPALARQRQQTLKPRGTQDPHFARAGRLITGLGQSEHLFLGIAQGAGGGSS